MQAMSEHAVIYASAPLPSATDLEEAALTSVQGLRDIADASAARLHSAVEVR